MNEVNNDQKASAIKTLAIIGFITAIVLGVWLAVQAVRLVPQGFRSLASLAEVIGSKDVKFNASAEKNIINSGESLALSWTTMRKSGAYEFSYACTDGISAQVRVASGLITAVCETTIPLPTDSGKTDIVFTSEKKRFTDVPLSVRYVPAVNMNTAEEKEVLVTVVNVALAEERDDTHGEVAKTDTDTAPKIPTPDIPKETPTAPTPVAKPVTTTLKPVVTTTFPTSNPNGYTDLAARFIAIGSFNESTRVFTPVSSLDNDKRGAVRFEIKNIGTKTSGSWTYRITLPDTDNNTYDASLQAPLKPGERAVITIAFGDIAQNAGTEKVRVEVRGGGDSSPLNNVFTQSVRVVN